MSYLRTAVLGASGFVLLLVVEALERRYGPFTGQREPWWRS